MSGVITVISEPVCSARFPCEERRVHISVSSVSAERLDVNLWMRNGKAFLCCPGQRLGIDLDGGFYLHFSPAETEKLVFKRAFSRAISADSLYLQGFRLNFKWMCLRLEKWRGKREKMSRVMFERNKARK